ncbi:MAG: hypothetical protein EA397_05170 [Deltaproteobacteria bacterium]|nr:MAG: hypothetical protein EA397_05170 [Deltaproteobacteria bacterium]
MSLSRLGRISLLTACCVSCSSGFAVGVPHVVLETERLDLTELPVGLQTRTPIGIHNTGTASVRVRVELEAPLRVAVDAFTLAADGRSNINLLVRPESFEPFEGTVRVRAGGVVRTIQVSGTVATDFDGDGFDALGAGGDDCDDFRADVYPGAPEVCDGVDNNCDGEIDLDAIDATTSFRDADGDSYGDPSISERSCLQPIGYVLNSDDCDDSRADINPSMVEITDGLDQNCNGLIDEHLLVPRALAITEVHLGDGDVPGYLEIRGRSPSRLYLEHVALAHDDQVLSLPPITLDRGQIRVLCGVEDVAEIEGLPCDGPLPGPLGPDLQISMTALSTFEALDLAPLALDVGRSAELAPEAAADGRSGDPADWCPSTRPLADSSFGTPWTLEGHCEGEP